nr:hypothetical protein Iba_chr12fCG19130 [Ipomoea batatas]
MNLSNPFISSNSWWWWPHRIYTYDNINIRWINWSRKHSNAYVVIFDFYWRKLMVPGDRIRRALLIVDNGLGRRRHGRRKCSYCGGCEARTVKKGPA